MTSKEAAVKCKVSGRTLRNWCVKNNIKRKLGKQGVMEYDLSDTDLKAFKARNKQRGRPSMNKKTTK